MRSSTDLFFDSRPSRSIVSAALPAGSINADESTGLLYRVEPTYSATHKTSKFKKNRIQEVLDIISFLEKVQNSWYSSRYLNAKDRNNWGLVELTCKFICMLACLGFTTIAVLALYKLLKYDTLHNYNKIKILGNQSVSCQTFWPVDDFMEKHCTSMYADAIYSANSCGTNEGCRDIMQFCRKDHEKMCNTDDIFGWVSIAFVFGMFIACLAMLRCLTLGGCKFFESIKSLNLLFSRNNILFNELLPIYRDPIEAMLKDLGVSDLIIQSETLLTIIDTLKKKFGDVILLETIDEILNLENTTISYESHKSRQLTYFAALKQDSRLLKPYHYSSDEVISRNKSQLTSYQKIKSAFFSPREEADALVDSVIYTKNPEITNSSTKEKYLACGNDVNDMIFSYALGRKYSGV